MHKKDSSKTPSLFPLIPSASVMPLHIAVLPRTKLRSLTLSLSPVSKRFRLWNDCKNSVLFFSDAESYSFQKEDGKESCLVKSHSAEMLRWKPRGPRFDFITCEQESHLPGIETRKTLIVSKYYVTKKIRYRLSTTFIAYLCCSHPKVPWGMCSLNDFQIERKWVDCSWCMQQSTLRTWVYISCIGLQSVATSAAPLAALSLHWGLQTVLALPLNVQRFKRHDAASCMRNSL